MPRSQFRIVRFDEGGVRGVPARRRLVCVTDAGTKIALWGREEEPEGTANIRQVVAAGLPCTIECDWIEPNEAWALRPPIEHDYWVPEGAFVDVKAGS